MNHLQLYVGKTQIILIGKPTTVNSVELVSISVGGAIMITSTNRVKSLGLTTDWTLTRTEHVSSKINCVTVIWALYLYVTFHA